jgi:hypothetical protein
MKYHLNSSSIRRKMSNDVSTQEEEVCFPARLPGTLIFEIAGWLGFIGALHVRETNKRLKNLFDENSSGKVLELRKIAKDFVEKALLNCNTQISPKKFPARREPRHNQGEHWTKVSEDVLALAAAALYYERGGNIGQLHTQCFAFTVDFVVATTLVTPGGTEFDIRQVFTDVKEPKKRFTLFKEHSAVFPYSCCLLRDTAPYIHLRKKGDDFIEAADSPTGLPMFDTKYGKGGKGCYSWNMINQAI